jgi:hypothetical protein
VGDFSKENFDGSGNIEETLHEMVIRIVQQKNYSAFSAVMEDHII